MSQNKVQKWVIVNKVMNLRVPYKTVISLSAVRASASEGLRSMEIVSAYCSSSSNFNVIVK
jgi:hypothetical protein